MKPNGPVLLSIFLLPVFIPAYARTSEQELQLLGVAAYQTGRQAAAALAASLTITVGEIPLRVSSPR